MFRDAVYNNGNWIIGQHVQEPESRHFAVEGNAVLNRFAASLSAESDRPTAKFMHLFNTHLPVVMNEDCTYVGETVEFGRATFKAQVSCAVDRLESLFASMKEAGVYDRTAIVVLSDHGTTGLGSSKSKGEGEISTGLIGVANPTLAFKALGASGAFSTSTQPMSLSDVAGLICGNMGDCIAPERTGDRFFNRYTWSAEYWNSDTLPDLTQFRISGSVWNPRAWERVSK
jgi:arylsulfatase A-like enzyme